MKNQHTTTPELKQARNEIILRMRNEGYALQKIGDRLNVSREYIRQITEKSDNAIIIASYGTFSTGINIRNLHNIVFSSPSKSRIRNLQSIGRGLRLKDNKSDATLYDISDDMTYNKIPNYTLRHFWERLNIYKEEKFNYETHNIEIKDE